MWVMTVGQKPLLHLSPAFSPHVPAVNTGIERQNDFTSKSYLVHILSPGTKPRRRPEVFSLGHNHEECCVLFSPLVEKWWLCFSWSIPAGLFMEPKEGDIQGGQHAAFCFPARVRVWQRARLEEAGLPSVVGERRVGQKVGKTWNQNPHSDVQGLPVRKNTHQTPTDTYLGWNTVRSA